MKSRTSFFNLTLYKKDITRFAPLWILYTVVMMLIMLPLMNVGWNNSVLDRAMYRVDVLAETIGAMSVMNLLYAVMAAQLLFGELFNTRLCNALHAMPIRREARFGSHLAAGLSFSIVPNLLIGMLMMQDMGNWWYAPLLWCGALTLQYLFFFGVAVFAMHCTGNRFAAVLVYAIINFASMAALWFASVIFVPMMRGVILDWEAFGLLSPVVKMCTMSDFFSVDVEMGGKYYFAWGQQWPLLWIYATVGVAALAGALLIYRRRALECAGDFMAVKAMKPVFLVLYTLCIGVFFAVFGSLFGNDIYVLFLIVGMVIGFFTGKMLLERTIRVFQFKSFLHLGLFVLLMWLALQAVQFDVFGIERYVPNPDAVKRAEVTTYYYGGNQITVTDPEELKILQEGHKLAIEEEGCKHNTNRKMYYLTYYMKDGRTVKREYMLCPLEQAYPKFERLLSSPKAILGINGKWEDYIKAVTDIYVEDLVLQNHLNPEDWESFLDCVYEDCENGLMSDRGGVMSNYTVTIWHNGNPVHLSIREDSASFEWLEAFEKKLLLKYIQEVTSVELGSVPIPEEYHEELIKAIYEDCKEYNLFWNGNSSSDAVYVVGIKTGFWDEEKVFWVPEYAHNTYEWIKNYYESNPPEEAK